MCQNHKTCVHQSNPIDDRARAKKDTWTGTHPVASYFSAIGITSDVQSEQQARLVAAENIVATYPSLSANKTDIAAALAAYDAKVTADGYESTVAPGIRTFGNEA